MDLTQGILNPCPASGVTGTSAQLFLTLINTLIASQCTLGPEGKYPEDYALNLRDGDEYDFIIVGSGSAGSLVASRLSENPNWRILLLEAGHYPSSTSEIPQACFVNAYNPNNWVESMEPSTSSCLGFKNNVCVSPRGKGLGGTSTINGMMYLRGSRNDYDGWAEAGNTGWDYDSVLKHFKNFEDLQEVEDRRFGKDGNLKISQNFNDEPIRKILMEAYQEVGYTEYNEENPTGYLDAYTTISEGTRMNTAKAFLTHARTRQNLHIALNAQVSKLLIKDEAVYGVQVRINNQLLQIKSKREVIVSAGAINSPQILMNSGIGPEKHLSELGIPIVRNLKVGENLQDHTGFFGIFMNIEQDALLPKTHKDSMDEMYQYFMHRKGPISRSGIENFILHFDSKHNFNESDMQLYYISFYQNDPNGVLAVVQNILNLPHEASKVQKENNDRSHNVLLLPVLLNPKSRGKILLRSTNPFDRPKIIPNYFTDEGDEDLEAHLRALRFCQNLTTTNAFSRYKFTPVHLDILNCRNFTPDSDDYWKCAVRNLASTLYHPTGTCKMGSESDPGAVVDAKLRVHGVKGVRVIDASIMPNIVRANTNAASIMIGEKGAQMIKEVWMDKHTEL